MHPRNSSLPRTQNQGIEQKNVGICSLINLVNSTGTNQWLIVRVWCKEELTEGTRSKGGGGRLVGMGKRGAAGLQ